jgi:hypothetical protein
MFWKVWYPAIVISGLWGGIVAQFIWKLIYTPEPLVWVALELAFVTVLSALAVVRLLCPIHL